MIRGCRVRRASNTPTGRQHAAPQINFLSINPRLISCLKEAQTWLWLHRNPIGVGFNGRSDVCLAQSRGLVN